MNLFKITIGTLFAAHAFFLTACNDEINIENVAYGSNEYWCYVSGGVWKSDDETNPEFPKYCHCKSSLCIQNETIEESTETGGGN